MYDNLFTNFNSISSAAPNTYFRNNLKHIKRRVTIFGYQIAPKPQNNKLQRRGIPYAG